ncbi:L-aspartate oxidase [Parahalioglobus pacificus]|uniref:L-aspartate oxidase n=1 Tax=Parahalioglobus pacificus TaxID=930806 RepID=A0A918XEL9_9GAMM|nr:L-aspartate oxidase [Halioglobus pacificus]NQY03855.1 L-aspartate oxidase [Halieaceae bacterium]GHD28339.1 L-aspartate oxidase [Halioglobus pacificus]
MPQQLQHDVLVIGSGAAGLSAALHLPDSCRVALLSKADLNQGSTYWAQGGMAAVLHDRDTVDSHVEDTLTAGAGLCHRDAVEFTVRNSRRCVEWLVSQGVDFDLREDQPDPELREFHLTMEGGHSHRRIIHAADRTGRAISEVLTEKAQAADNIEIYTQRVAVDLVIQDGRCVGAYILDQERDRVDLFLARSVVLATGGASKAYLYTSNPDGASGDGIAMAWRAGCRVANLEFNQFHPTCLYHPKAKSFLVTEALRGEGARLLLPTGEPFMHHFDERGELAPRDIVARAIDHEMKRLGVDCVYLDISHRPREFLAHHFPTVMARCAEFSIDIAAEPIPVVPAAHYTCGGVIVDQHSRTDVQGLYVVGESSCTGLHGANRMASNSLLECIVYAEAAAQHISEHLDTVAAPTPTAPWDESQVTDSDEDVVISHNWDELRRFMWDYVGIVRTNKRLQRARHRVDVLQSEIAEYYGNYKVSNDLLELRNLAMVAELMIRCAIERKESRGLHYTLDYPEALRDAKDTILTPDHSPLGDH